LITPIAMEKGVGLPSVRGAHVGAGVISEVMRNMATTAQLLKWPHPKIAFACDRYDHRMLDDSLVKIVDVVKRTGDVLGGLVFFPGRLRSNRARSPHTDKKAREQLRCASISA